MFNNGFKLEAGLQVVFHVHAESETNNVFTDIGNNLNTVDFALGVGVGYVFTASGFGVDGRYNFGLNNINESGSVESNNRVFN